MPVHRAADTQNIVPRRTGRAAMQKPTPKPEDDKTESTTELIAALCEISIDTAETLPSGAQIEAVERRLKPEEPHK
jgi:hypothetical protein